jgi:nucleotide-binding universal stress UspA family protein
MSYTSLMAFIDGAAWPEGRVRLALRLAERFHATLIGVAAIAVRPLLVTVGGVITEDVNVDIIGATLEDRGARFHALAGATSVATEWRSFIEPPGLVLMREARSADLVVVGPAKAVDDFYRSPETGAVIIGLGRPALIVPEDVDGLRAAHVVISWKDGREARRALQDALPFLHGADSVTVVSICRPGEEDITRHGIDDVMRHLGRHRIAAASRVLSEDDPAKDTLRLVQVAQDHGADLLVTGAYGHSRLGEWMFGGMTRHLLSSSPICCLMSH